MSIVAGRDMALRLDNGQGGWTPLGGLRARSVRLAAGSVDVTHTESGGWRELLPRGGLRQATITGQGLFLNDAAAARARALFFAGETVRWQLAIPGTGRIEGAFQITGLDYSGDVRGEAAVSLTLASAGPVTFRAEGG